MSYKERLRHINQHMEAKLSLEKHKTQRLTNVEKINRISEKN